MTASRVITSVAPDFNFKTRNKLIKTNKNKSVINLAKQNKLYVREICRVKGNEKSKIIRTLLVFSFFRKEIIESSLILEKSRHQYTEEYIKLTKKFYINM